MKREILCVAALTLALLAAGCQQAPPAAPKPDLKAEAAKIMEADAAWMKAAQAKDAAGHASFFTGDGSWLVEGHPKATGRDAIQKLSETLARNQVSLSWTTEKLEVSEAADYAFQIGAWESVENDAKGRPMKAAGKFLTVWRKQPDGNWKVQADASSPDGPHTPVK